MNWTSVVTTGITAIGAIGGSIFASTSAVQSNVSTIDTKVQLVDQRENLHYQQVLDKLNEISIKVDNLNKQK